MADWDVSFERAVVGGWPEKDGSPEEPAFLEHIAGSRTELDMERNMLWAYGIPTVCRYPNDGEFGNIMVGFAGGGVDIFVPVSMLEDAKNIISCDLSHQEIYDNTNFKED